MSENLWFFVLPLFMSGFLTKLTREIVSRNEFFEAKHTNISCVIFNLAKGTFLSKSLSYILKIAAIRDLMV